MNLNPIRKHDEPSYPDRVTRPGRWRSWLRRAAIAAGVSAAIMVAVGCDGGPFNPRISGDMPPPEPHGSCGYEAPERTPLISVPGSYDSNLCGDDQSVWGKFELQLFTPLQFSFNSGAEYVATLRIIDSEGEIVDELGPDEGLMELTLAPGTYYVEIAPGDLYYYSSFSLSIAYAL